MRTVGKQARRHAAAREAAAKGRDRVPPGDDDLFTVERELDLRPWVKPRPVTKLLRDHDLPLAPYAMSHTCQV
jgi:hypothetical protein